MADQTPKRSRAAASVIEMEPGELSNFPELLLDYENWKDHPITKMVFKMLQDAMRPNANGTDFVMTLASDKGLVGTALYARQCGAQWMIDYAMSLGSEDAPIEELESNFEKDED